ncbi:MAG: preprotein translocase subunit SecY [Patescibacteria group bacterium]|nr:preprotein translocase subunit SecY [Patescibacteria group bacterium]
MWFDKIIQIFKIPDLRKKIFFVLGVFIIFRLMANITIPGIGIDKVKEFFERFQMLGLLNVFSGGTLENLSIIMLGLGPYITAVIIMQLLTMIFPQLEKMYKEEGEAGRRKFNQYSRIATVPLSIVQGYAMLTLFQKQGAIGQLSPTLLVSSIITVTAGTLFLMWLGELITERGIGNGVSLLIFAGIIAQFPVNIREIILKWDPANLSSYIFFLIMALAIIAGVVLINEGRRNIPVSYAKRVRGMKMYGGVSTYLPLNVNPAGVIPIIFALSIMLFPGMIASFLAGNQGFLGVAGNAIGNFFNSQQNPWGYGILYFLLVFLFTYFYTSVTFDPKAISSNLQKMGGFMHGIRPGKSTAVFLTRVLNRILVIGGLFLGIIAVMPSIVGGITGVTNFSFLVGGTALLIVVAVVLETMRQIKSQLQMREYETF